MHRISGRLGPALRARLVAGLLGIAAVAPVGPVAPAAAGPEPVAGRPAPIDARNDLDPDLFVGGCCFSDGSCLEVNRKVCDALGGIHVNAPCNLLTCDSAAVGTAPTDLVFVIDASGSIWNDEWDLQTEGLAAAIEDPGVIPPTGAVSLAIVVFSTSASIEIPLTVIDSPATATALADQIRSLSQPGGTTNIATAIKRAVEAFGTAGDFGTPGARQVICLSTDGVHNEDGDPLEEAQEAMDAGVDEIDTIGVGDGIDAVLLEAIAEIGEGVFATVEDFQEFADTIDDKLQGVIQILGACCLPDGGCQVVTQEDCETAGGDFQGIGVECAPGLCPSPIGACCLPNGMCIETDKVECASLGGSFQGREIPCTPDLCPLPLGACCFEDGSCSVLTEQDCITAGGTWQGMDTFCHPNDCPQPLGACCIGDGSCSVVTESTCGFVGGSWQGMDTVCDPNPCPQPIGACCFEDGSCSELTEDECLAAGGTWSGMFTDCTPNDCPQPLGACCIGDGSCAVVTQDTCGFVGGIWQGMDTVCEPNPCPQPGACCLEDLSACIDGVLLSQCEAQGGIFQGEGTVCSEICCASVFDVETADDGTTPLVNGQSLEVPGVLGTLLTVSSLGLNDGVAVFDTDPNGPNAGGPDPDLLVGTGNAMILQTSGSDECSPGVFCEPNDSANGGTFVIDYVQPVRTQSLLLIDIDLGDGFGARVTLRDADGFERVYTVPAGFTAEGGAWTLDLQTIFPQQGFLLEATAEQDPGFDPDRVVQIRVLVSGSAALDDLAFCAPGDEG